VLVVALVFAGLAALVHVYIFVLESLRWEAPATRAVFGIDAPTAALTKQLAFNQGFYNLFLAIGAGVGVAVTGADREVGLTLVVLAVGSMLAAAVVLVGSDPAKARAAIVQGGLPLICLLDLAAYALS
jgi:putative membrane protein